LKNFQQLKKRIKKNEGYSNAAYKDSLNFWTIGYGHLIKKNEKRFLSKKFKKKELLEVFHVDFQKAFAEYQKNYYKDRHSQNVKEVFIEMIFQMGIKKQKKFKKMIEHINKKNLYMAALEMKKSLWNQQTPKRVAALTEILLKKEYEKNR
tara:strand:+ start:1276 stop:1725 length:450 start_codon:yes stop_codon:yes gene_type:complete